MKSILSGVYILYDNTTPVYVGQSKDIYRRISEHRTGNKKHTQAKVFDSWEYIEIQDEEERIRTESLLINTLRPKYNVDYGYIGSNIPTPRRNENTDIATQILHFKHFCSFSKAVTESISLKDFDDMFSLRTGTAYDWITDQKIPDSALERTEGGTLLFFYRIRYEWIYEHLNEIYKWRNNIQYGRGYLA